MRRPARSGAFALLVLLAGLGSGCLRPRPTSVPIQTLRFPDPGGPRKCLVVLLPGRRDRPADFESQQLVSLLRESGAACDAQQLGDGPQVRREIDDGADVQVAVGGAEKWNGLILHNKLWLVNFGCPQFKE